MVDSEREDYAAFQRAIREAKKKLKKKNPPQKKYVEFADVARGEVPAFVELTRALMNTLEMIKLVAPTFANPVGLEDYLSTDPIGPNHQRFEGALHHIDQKRQARGAHPAHPRTERNFCERFSYDQLQLTKLIMEHGCLKAFTSGENEFWERNLRPGNLPDLRYWGYVAFEGFNEDYPDANSLLHHLFERHRGELISVHDSWEPCFEELPASSGSKLWLRQLTQPEVHKELERCNFQRQACMAADSSLYKGPENEAVRHVYPGAQCLLRKCSVMSLPSLVWYLGHAFSVLHLTTFFCSQPLVAVRQTRKDK